MVNAAKLDGAQARDMIRVALACARSGPVLHRLDAVLLVAEGQPCGEVARLFGVDRRTVERWVHAAYVGGVDALAEHHHGGRPGRLSADQTAELQALLRAPPSACGYGGARWCGKRLASHVAKIWGVSLSVRTCQRLMAGAHAPGADER